MIFYDFEVFKYNWLLCAVDTDRERVIKIWDDKDALQNLYAETAGDIYVGYNSRHYDQYIYQGILCGFNPYEISRHIIEKEQPGWSFSNALRRFPMLNHDVMSIIDRGLKFFEASMGNDIRETEVPFDIDRPLTDEEKRKTEFYCNHDVEQTMEVFGEKYDEFYTTMYFIKHFKLPLNFINKTKAQLAAYLLGGNGKGKKLNDEFDFPLVECLRLDKYKHIADWYRLNKDYGKSQKVTVAGVPHTYSWGGGHGALTKYHAKGIFIIVDVTAYYPSMQERFKFGYRVMDKPENFEFIHHSNIEFKRKGDKKARLPFKLMDNAISGQMKQKQSTLYDPMSNNAICINGQMLLLDLVEKLEPYAKLIQNNTDGIILEVADYERNFDKIDDAVYEWEKRTGLKMDFETYIGEIFQKDVNNYLLIDRENGHYKAKGAYVKGQSRLDYDLPIVNKALRAYMIDGTLPEQTINACDELKEFQLMAKLSSKYTHAENARGEKLNEKTLRIFASTDQSDTILYKVSKITGKPQKIANCPEHGRVYNDSVNGVQVPRWLDKKWYVDMAYKRLADFGISEVRK